MKFDIFNSDTWHLLKDDTPLVYDNEVILSVSGEPIKAIEFVNFMKAMSTVLKNSGESGELDRKTVEKLLQRMKDGNIKELKTESFILTPETEDKEESGFNPFDVSTWNFAKGSRIMRIYNTRIKNDGKYLSEKDFVNELRAILKYKHITAKDKTDSEVIESHLQMTHTLYAENKS